MQGLEVALKFVVILRSSLEDSKNSCIKNKCVNKRIEHLNQQVKNRILEMNY
jgi:hypothetical protein